MVSQSGAFMITRLSQNPWLDPRYMLALGNQTDLTHGDMLAYFAERPEIETIGIYLEGLQGTRRSRFRRGGAPRRAERQGRRRVQGRQDRSRHGRRHGPHRVDRRRVRRCSTRSCATPARSSPTISARSTICSTSPVRCTGRRSAASASARSAARASRRSAWPTRSTPTDFRDGDGNARRRRPSARWSEILAAKRLDALVEVRNPIDINPGADDEAHLQITEAFLQDPNIDAVVVGLDPTAPAIRALESEQAAARLRHQRSEEHRAPDAAPRRAQRQAGHRHRGQRRGSTTRWPRA